ncbi:hypothetical protein AKJ41_03150 [candidate division MSBL1 archaeon SCGC-AAA259O05]|uniref:Uncharacterized protein n=1 Tax=candidate division MSBL1 archaeon SCGC-AAA259O05 TaxID=1698271 RepID=A0A133V3I3_9EURY|nr:hypothetical protein AKJ41_03150 [candidate division MSBL1 archaeon SCGC-AAA259O05]
MVEMTQTKFERMEKLSDDNGVIKAAAMDQRGSLVGRLADACDIPKEEVTNDMMEEFKEAGAFHHEFENVRFHEFENVRFCGRVSS